MFWEEHIKIPAYIADRTDHLEIWGLARLVQEAADHHTEATGCGFAEMLKQDHAWVLARMYYQIHRMPAVGEEVTIRTWSRGCDGLQFARDAEVVDEKGEVVVGVTTIWVVINYSNRKLVRMNDLLSDYEHHDRCATDVKVLKRLVVPKMFDQDYVKQIPIEESMIDHNNHMNNAEYLKVIFDALADQEIKREEISFEINYLQESHLGDALSLNRTMQEGNYFFQINNSKGISITAKVTR